jgi:hypothetical protein
MFAEAITRAVKGARTDELDHLAREIWRAHAAGVLDDAAAQAAAEAVHARRASGPALTRKSAPRASARRPQRSPDKAASIERRRRLAASGPIPPTLACRFTTCELAALKVVAEEVAKHGVCSLHLDAIAAIGGTCRTVVQNALRVARALGLVTVSERRRRGRRSLTNLVRVVSPEWLTWLRRGRGFRKLNTTHPQVNKQEQPSSFGTSWRRHFQRYDPSERDKIGP